ncbi:MAG: glutamine--tRNA ligase/YqeY domain fusion protein [Clostridiaceae bacterium]|nr:glutamine--tRNA ligase/YqeY domain fusion protein [Clostridiaceae bacterium]
MEDKKVKEENLNFIDAIIKKDMEKGICKEIHTRFPPEPNGYLHIGSAYAINISYSLAKKYGGKFNLRFDDTNPTKEDESYMQAIKEDIKWLGVDYGDKEFFGSDYSEKVYSYAKDLIKKGKAYVCELSAEEIKDYRGTLTTPGKNSPYRDRSIEENLALFEDMKNGKFKEGEAVLRAKIDMASPNMNMRDPVIYRISYKEHYRTKNEWCIYPMYDFAHPLQDYTEGITYSLCSNEFKDHRPLYEWVLNSLDLEGALPRQIEFGRMNLTGVVMSKRYLRALVEQKIVDGWDDPRLPTLKGLKRRGYTKESIINFLGEIGVPKSDSTVDAAMLQHSIREDLIEKVPRIMAVMNPLKVVITNYPEGKIEYLNAENNRDNEALGSRRIPFGRNIYIDREDFSENPPAKFKRLVQGKEVRLMHAYFIKCEEIIKDEKGEIVELRCTYDERTKSGSGFNERKVKGTIHWVSADINVPCELRLYNDLFLEKPDIENLASTINKDSLIVKKNCFIEAAINDLSNYERFQFVRNGFYIRENKNTDKLTFNRIVELKSNKKAKSM